jgi:hypothetical protein
MAAIEGIDTAARSTFYIQAGLLSGRAGMILFQARLFLPTTLVREAAVTSQLHLLGWHAVPYHGGLAFPGEQNLRLSMDLATGTAGVLLALGAALHHNPINLPFLTSRTDFPYRHPGGKAHPS